VACRKTVFRLPLIVAVGLAGLSSVSGTFSLVRARAASSAVSPVPVLRAVNGTNTLRSVRTSTYAQIDLGVASPGIAAIVRTPTNWWVAGSFRDEVGEHRPGLWKSMDAIVWTRIETVAITPYGEVSELYSLAVDEHGVAAIGMATGGAHGNPRTVSWVLQADGKLHEVAANFELYNGVRQISVRTISAGPSGFVIFGTRNNRNDRIGATAWTSIAADDFTIRDSDSALSSGPGEFVQGLDVTATVDGYIAVGERLVIDGSRIDTDGMAWTSDDGISWQRFAPLSLRLGGLGDQRAQRVAAQGTRTVIAGTQTNGTKVSFISWTTIDGVHWKRSVLAGFGTSQDALSNVTGLWNQEGQMIVGARVGATLRAVSSTDGVRWNVLALPRELPISDRARLVTAISGTELLVGASVFGVAQSQGGGLWIQHVR
jgi:hypothetical protein